MPTSVVIREPVVITVKGNTTEQVLRELAAHPEVDAAPIITELVARYDAKALRRAAKATEGDDND